ncbi:HAD family hydrolase [Niabella ginsengisoli]|uniref:HAD family phosphatase n=1 Tax=Niabella ginsengisoli TaxID=522298 RepID=A0ABS9SN88_9BACT|nr:HAD family phosphatase [Niabella ginsengisoli]MCH5599736.1 HAD family phosphatase [Niabella ginsengisoli]
MIKNILFDFGGVFYNLDFKKTFEAFEKMGFSDFENMFSQYNADSLFQDLETGKITPAAFYTRIKEIAPKDVTDEQIRDAWNALLLGFRESSLDYLLELKKEYNLYLLSNTNQIHYEYFANQLSEQTKHKLLESFFIKAYYSQNVGLRKPDIEVFEFILKDAGIKPEETLFVDDSYTNFPNAEKLGMKIHLLKPDELIENIDYKSFN